MKCSRRKICKNIQKIEGVTLNCTPCSGVQFLSLLTKQRQPKKETIDYIKNLVEIPERTKRYICPYTRTIMQSKCSITSCHFYTEKDNHCIIAYAKDRKGVLSEVEISLFTGIEQYIIRKKINKGLNHLRKLNIKEIINKKNYNECAKCKNVVNLVKEGEFYLCKDKCLEKTKHFDKLEKEYDAPILVILLTTLEEYKKISVITKMLNLTRKDIRYLISFTGKNINNFTIAPKKRTKFLKRRIKYPSKWFDVFKKEINVTPIAKHKKFLETFKQMEVQNESNN